VKRIAILILPIVLWACLAWGGAAVKGPKVTDATIQAYFSPDGGCTEAVVKALGRAKNTVKVQAYFLHLYAHRQGPGGCPRAGCAGESGSLFEPDGI
jgi:hypothetical protein